jgi:hypothetical protein
MLKESPIKVKLSAQVDKKLTEELKNNQHFTRKLEWAKDFIKGRDILKEIEEADNKISKTK